MSRPRCPGKGAASNATARRLLGCCATPTRLSALKNARAWRGVVSGLLTGAAP